MQISLLASFEARPLEPIFDYWSERLQWNCSWQILPAHQLYQQLLSVAPADLEVVLARLEDLGEDGQQELEHALEARVERGRRPCLAYLCPGPARRPREIPGVVWLEPALVDLYSPQECPEGSPELPFSHAFYAALGTALVRSLASFLVKPIKLIVVDADNTLWDGVVAEDGLEALEIGPDRCQLQSYLQERVAAGCLLAVCSKNAPADVERVFQEHPAMLLRADQVLAWLVGWEPKSVQVLRLLQELNLGLESVLVLDDNELEVAELRGSHIQAVQVPPAGQIPSFLQHLWWFGQHQATAADGQRLEFYQQQAQRRRAQSESADLAEFLAGLRLNIRFAEVCEAELARAAQLTVRTNQFHLAPRTRTPPECSGATGVWVDDRFGDYGLVGLLMWRTEADSLLVETFLLSCRALGRGVEHAMLRQLGDRAGERALLLDYQPNERNVPAGRFLQEVLGPSVQTGWNELSPGRARQVVWTPDSSPAAQRAAVVFSPAGSCPELAQVAAQRWTAARLLEALRERGRRPRPSLSVPFLEPQDARQRQVALVWSEVLGIEPVGRQDGFFELGGDSLAMLAVLARLQEVWGLAPSLDQFLAQPTVEGLAEAPGPEIASSQLEWVTDLSDQEVERLLAQLQQPTLIERLAIPSAGRGPALSRAIGSFHQHLRERGRPTGFLVSDQSEPAHSEESRQRLGELARRQDIELDYAGCGELQRLRSGLVEEGLEPELVAFALGGELAGPGSNRNNLQLLLGKTAYLSLDDDTLASRLIYGDLEALPRLCPGSQAEEIFGESEFSSQPPLEVDLLSLHESLLGRLRVELAEASPDLPRSEPPDAWVGVTFHGLVGDCGLAAPFGLWEEPLGLLWLNESSHRRWVDEESTYRAALLNRRHLRMAPGPVLSDGVGSLSTFMAIDSSRLLPPWFPGLRGEDRLFPALLSAAHPTVLFGHLPVAAGHEPMPARRFSPGELFRSAAGIDMARLLVEVVELWAPGDWTTPEQRLAALGTHFEELAGDDSRERLLPALQRRNQTWVAALESRQGPAWWRADAEEYGRRILQAQLGPDYWLPVDLQAKVGRERAPQQVRRFLRLFGRLLRQWPDFLDAAQRLVGQRPMWTRLSEKTA